MALLQSLSAGLPGRKHCSSTASLRLKMSTLGKRGDIERKLRHFFAIPSKIVLGSESPSRREIMSELASEYGFVYETTKAAIDEASLGSRASDPEALVLLLAKAKAEAILSKNALRGPGYLITCDQVVVCDNAILEKPRSIEEARRFIRSYSDSSGKTVGSVVCTNLLTNKMVHGIDVSEVHFRHIPDTTVELLIKQGAVMGCAGGLMVEHPEVAPLIAKIDGTLDSVKGLSKRLLLELLLQALGS